MAENMVERTAEDYLAYAQELIAWVNTNYHQIQACCDVNDVPRPPNW
jgi:hypothetical protein